MVIDTDSLLTLLLIFLRVSAFVFMVPLFGTFFMPGFVRVYLSFALALSVLFMGGVEPVEVHSALQLLSMALQEVIFGFTAGFFLRLFFDAIFIAGEIIAIHTGLGFLMMFLPQQPQTTVLAGFSTLLGSTLFLTLGGAEAVYVGLLKSFESLPIGSFSVYSLNGELFLKLFYRSFSMGMKVALPVLIASLLTNVILAIINRFIPQINVFMVGLPLQIMVGLTVLMLALPVLGLVLVSYMREYMLNFIRFVGSA